MRKAFALVTQNATAENQDAIRERLSPFGWWHYMPDFWLLVDATGTWNATKLRDAVSEVCPGLVHYAFEISPGADYAGFAIPAWHEWLRTEWQKK